jgi:hypothetical protein
MLLFLLLLLLRSAKLLARSLTALLNYNTYIWKSLVEEVAEAKREEKKTYRFWGREEKQNYLTAKRERTREREREREIEV